MLILRFICIALIGLTSADALAELSHLELMHDGVNRGYELFVPPTYDGSTALPLVLALHGRAGSGERMAHLTGFDLRAAENHFFVAYPNSLDDHWNYLHGIPGAREGPDDVDFLIRLVDAIGSEFRIDRERLYVTGISNGGFMAQRLACEPGAGFRAFASVAASGYGAMPATCAPKRPVDALYLHGTADRLSPWQGQSVTDGSGDSQVVTLTVSESMKFWSRVNHCDAELETRDLPRSGRSPETRVRIYSTRACDGGARVSLYAIVGGGHNWPGRDGLIPPHIAGAVNLDFHATDAIWSFFDRR